MSTINLILVPVDLSESSAVALRYAQTLAAASGGTVSVLYVMENPHMTPGGVKLWEFTTPELVDKLQQAAADELDRFVGAHRQSGVALETSSRVGSAAAEITECAGEKNVDLIVIGTHGRSGLTHALLGSVAERVMRTAPCPVLTVRPTVV